jgi:hypothetical protein
VLQNTYAIPVYYVYGEYFTTDRAGTLDATIDYTYANSQILVWIARSTCTPSLFAVDQCEYLATSFAGPKPRRVSVTGAAAGNYLLLVGNLGPQDESVSYQVVLTPTASSGASRATIRALPGDFLAPLPRP